MKSTDDFEDYLDYHEFFELFWDRVSEDLVSNMYIDDNEEFIKEITFSMYDEYREDRITLNLAARLSENFIKSLFRNKPSTSNLVENQYL